MSITIYYKNNIIGHIHSNNSFIINNEKNRIFVSLKDLINETNINYDDIKFEYNNFLVEYKSFRDHIGGVGTTRIQNIKLEIRGKYFIKNIYHDDIKYEQLLQLRLPFTLNSRLVTDVKYENDEYKIFIENTFSDFIVDSLTVKFWYNTFAPLLGISVSDICGFKWISLSKEKQRLLN